MEYIAKFILVVLLIAVMVAVIYKIIMLIVRLIQNQIENYIDHKNAHIIQVEIEKTEKMLKEYDFERTTLEKARQSGKNFTGIL